MVKALELYRHLVIISGESGVQAPNFFKTEICILNTETLLIKRNIKKM